MKINNIDISSFSAELLDRRISTNEITSVTDWIEGAEIGKLIQQKTDYKAIRLEFLVTGTSEKEAYTNISKLANELKQSSLVFEDLPGLTFECLLNGQAEPERIQNGVFKVLFLLKNDYAKGLNIIFEREFDIKKVYSITVEYKEDWDGTMLGYAQCFNKEERYPYLATEVIKFDYDFLVERLAAAASWDEAFANLGLELNKHKPGDNYQSGTIMIDEVFSQDTAATLLTNLTTVSLHYDRLNRDKQFDFPSTVDYPNVVVCGDNVHYFDTLVGQDFYNLDLNINAWGRYTEESNSGCLFGNSAGELSLGYYDGDINIDWRSNNVKNYPFAKSSVTSGGNVNIVTLEPMRDLPIRKYGIKNDKPRGFMTGMANNQTLTRINVEEEALTENILALKNDEDNTILDNGELSRLQIIHNDEVIRDLVPINSSVKNCFVNEYDDGLYDMKNMEFIPWTDGTTEGSKPEEFMPIPDDFQPITPEGYFRVQVINGGGSGFYKKGDKVAISAAPGEGFFLEWQAKPSDAKIKDASKQNTTLTVQESNIIITAVYSDVPPVGVAFYNETTEEDMTKIDTETIMGANQETLGLEGVLNDGPSKGDYFTLAYTIPDVPGEWTVSQYTNTVLRKNGQGVDKWGRTVAYLSYGTYSGHSFVYGTATFTPTDTSIAPIDADIYFNG